MSDEVGVQPGRLNELASKLEQLRDVLAANVPTIVSTLNEYWSAGQGAPINLSPLQHAPGQSAEDAADIRARSNMAFAWEDKANARLPGGMVNIPWDRSPSELNAASAQAAAQLLAQAEAESAKDPKAAQAEIQEIEADIQDHLDEGQPGAAWLAAFYNQAGPQIANLAAALHDLNGSANLPINQELQQVFSGHDEQILKTFATGLADVDSQGLLKPSTIKQLIATRTLWSMGMLIKYGPPGSAYGTQDPSFGSQDFLAQLTQAMFKAYQNGTLQIPLGTKYPPVVQDDQQINQGLVAYDPRSAAQQLLSGPEGSALASFLLNGGGLRYAYDPFGDPPGKDFTILGPNDPVKYPDNVYAGELSQQATGSFLDAATAAPRGVGVPAHQAAQAAYNIISQTPAPILQGGTVIWQVSSPVRQALLAIFARYMPDLAYSTNTAAFPGPPVSQPDGPWAIEVNSAQLSAFLREICLDKNDFTAMEAMAGMAMGTSIGLVAKHQSMPGMSASPTDDFAQLYARISTEADDVGITEAQQKDLRDQELNQMVALAEAGFSVLPGGGDVMTGAKALAAIGAPFIPQFSTDNAANTIAAAQSQQANMEMLAAIPLVRGLAATGALQYPPPADAFDPKGNPTEALGTWWREHSNQVVDGKSLSDWLDKVREDMGLQGTEYLDN
jgi:hypothetical protein